MKPAPRSSSSGPSTQEMRRGKKRTHQLPRLEMSGLAAAAAAALEGETLEVSHGALSNLQSPGGLLGKEWAINKGLPGSKNLLRGSGFISRGSAWKSGRKSVTGPWAPPPSQQSCNSLVRRVRWVSRFWGGRDHISPRKECTKSSCQGLHQGSDLHQRDLEAFHHAFHVENEGVLI